MLTFVFNAGTVAKDCGGFGTLCTAPYSTVTQFHNGEKLMKTVKVFSCIF